MGGQQDAVDGQRARFFSPLRRTTSRLPEKTSEHVILSQVS